MLVLPVKTGQDKATAEADGDVGDNLSSQGTGDWGDGRHWERKCVFLIIDSC